MALVGPAGYRAPSPLLATAVNPNSIHEARSGGRKGPGTTGVENEYTPVFWQLASCLGSAAIRSQHQGFYLMGALMLTCFYVAPQPIHFQQQRVA